MSLATQHVFETLRMDLEHPRLALTVERHHGGEFHWALLELSDSPDKYVKLLESAQCYNSYRVAFDAGLAALWKMAPELDAG